MPTFNGYLAASLTGAVSTAADAGLSLDLEQQTADFSVDGWGNVSLPAAGGAFGDRVIDLLPQALAGYVAPAYGVAFYNRIWIIPSKTDFGNLTNEQIITIEAWNGYFGQQNLTDVTLVSLDGVEIVSGATSKTFSPLESAVYTIRVKLTGAPTFDGFLKWNFPLEQPVSRLSGRRVLSFPFRHNWANPVPESLLWKTDVLVSRNGTEQRIQVRGIPRRQLAYNYSLMNADEKRRFETLVAGWINRNYAIPIESDVRVLAADLAVGSNSFSIDASGGRDFDAGSLVMLWNNYNDSEIGEVTSVTDSAITLRQGVLKTWKAGARVFPVRIAQIADARAKQSRTTSTLAASEIVFDVKPTEKSIRRFSAAQSFPIYRGFPVLTYLQSSSEQQETEFVRETDELDCSIGSTRRESPHSGTRRRTVVRFKLKGRARIAEFLSFLKDRDGRRVPFWLATEGADFELQTPVGAISTGFRTPAFGYSRLLTATNNVPHPAWRDIAFLPAAAGASALYRRVTGVSESADGTYEQISLDTAFGANYSPADFTRISFLKFVRLDSDTIEMRWKTDELLDVTLPVIDLLNTPA